MSIMDLQFEINQEAHHKARQLDRVAGAESVLYEAIIKIKNKEGDPVVIATEALQKRQELLRR